MFRKLVWCIWFLSIALVVDGQTINILSGKDKQELHYYKVLQDKGYTFDQVSSDTELPFELAQKLAYHKNGVYWIRILVDNPSHYGGKFTLFTLPFIDNTVYYHNQDTQSWTESRTGVLTNTKARYFGMSPIYIKGNNTNTLYVKVNLGHLGEFKHPLKCTFRIEKETVTIQREQESWALCLATIFIVMMFLIYNAIIFVNSKDINYLFYLMIQVGGIIYISANFRIFNYLIPWHNFQPWISPNGDIYYFHLNLFIERIGMVIAIASYVQFTRYYLQTKFHFPKVDVIMKYFVILWVIFEIIENTVSFIGLIYLDRYLSLYSNLAMILQLVLIIGIAVASNIKGVYSSRYFLWTNLLSLLLLIVLAAYYVYIPIGKRVVWLPSLAIISQAVLFSMALVAKLRLEKLHIQQMQVEMVQLKLDIDQLDEQYNVLKDERTKIENAIELEKNQNEVLLENLANTKRQLASASLYIVQKNELLNQLKNNIQKIGGQLPYINKDLKNIESNIQNNQFLDNDWDRFKLHFEEVHPSFFTDLKSKYPDLTSYETKFCAYLHMHLSTKEIAGLLNIDPGSVRRAKTRLNKKMDGALLNTKD